MQQALRANVAIDPANDNQRGLTMQQLENLPIYFHTDDQRINAYLQKNRLHHGLFGRSQPPLNIRMVSEGGNGRIRLFLLCAVAASLVISALEMWGL